MGGGKGAGNDKRSKEGGGRREGRGYKRITWKALKEWTKTRSEKDREELKKERKRLREIRKEKKKEAKDKKREKLENSKNMTEFWEAISGFRAGRERKGEGIGKEDWVRHFKTLLGGRGEETENNDSGINKGTYKEEEGIKELDRKISVEEVELALGKMKNGKAEGEDGVAVEFLKNLPRTWLEEVVEVMNEMMEGEEFIEGWKTARIFPIHKGGDEEEVKNYRGVALLDSGYKLYASILEGRLRKWLEDNNKLGESQAGSGEAGALGTMFLY